MIPFAVTLTGGNRDDVAPRHRLCPQRAEAAARLLGAQTACARSRRIPSPSEAASTSMQPGKASACRFFTPWKAAERGSASGSAASRRTDRRVPRSTPAR